MSIVETLARELAEAIRDAGLQEVTVVRADGSLEPEPEDLQWYCGKPGSEAEGHLFLGASQQTWEEIGGASEGLLRRCIEKAFDGHAEAKQLVAGVISSEAPPREWPRVALEIGHGTGARLSLYCVVSRTLDTAWAAASDAASEDVKEQVSVQPSPSARMNPSDLLAQVHVPVSVSFGGTQIRMKELLNLSTGSVVELNQGLSDSVEIRVNNCLIALGEVVAVDGHYGVRVLELVSGGTKGIKT